MATADTTSSNTFDPASSRSSLLISSPSRVVHKVDNNTALVQFNIDTSNQKFTKSTALLQNPLISSPKQILPFAKRPIATNMCICSYNKKRFFPWKRAMQLMRLDARLQNITEQKLSSREQLRTEAASSSKLRRSFPDPTKTGIPRKINLFILTFFGYN